MKHRVIITFSAHWKFLIIFYQKCRGGTNNRRCVCFSFLNPQISGVERVLKPPQPPPLPLCVQMDFTRTFEANSKCNNINYVWSHFYQILVVLKYHRRLCNNIFDTDISRIINIPKNAKYTALMWVFITV